MSGFLKRDKTVNPAGGVNPASNPNVGQYGWTSYDANGVNQIIEYVNICKGYADSAKGSADYVESKFSELEQFIKYIETIYNQIGPIFNNIDVIYKDIVLKHTEIKSAHADVMSALPKVLAAEVTSTANATSSTASAAAAKVSETNAAASAQDAADIAEELRKGQIYRGTWNIQANNAYPTVPDTNSVWDITLNEGSLQHVFDGKTWYWGDRLLYLKDDNAFSQIEAGSGVASVNGKVGAVTIDAGDVGAVALTGSNMTGDLGAPNIQFTSSESRLSNSDGDVLVQSTKNYGAILFGNPNQDAYVVFKDFLRARHGATDYRVYHEGLKPTAQDVGALPTSGGSLTGNLTVAEIPNSIVVRELGTIRYSNAGSSWFHTRANTAGEFEIASGGEGEDSLVTVSYTGAMRTKAQGSLYGDLNKPTHADVGALALTGGTLTGNLTTTAGFYHESLPGSNKQLMVANTAGNVYVGNPTVQAIDLETSTGLVRVAEGASYHRVYHQGFKPTASDLGALSLKNGGVVESEVTVKAPTSGGINLGGSGSYAAVTPMLADTTTPITADSLRYYGTGDWRIGSSNRIYHNGYRPTAQDVGALPATPVADGYAISNVLRSSGPYFSELGFISANATNTATISIESPSDGTSPYIGTRSPGESGPSKSLSFDQSRINVHKPVNIISGGLDITGPNANIIQLHEPGVKAIMAYKPAGLEAFRIAGTNGAYQETVPIAQFDATDAAMVGKISSGHKRNRSWLDRGNSAFLSHQKDVQQGHLVGHISGIGHIPGVHLTEHSLGVLYNNSFNETSHTLWAVDEKDFIAAWHFNNGGSLTSPSGMRVPSDGNLYGTVFGGHIRDWILGNFAPLSDINHKRIVGESKISAVEQVGKMKFHEFVWQDTEATKQLSKRDMKLNRIGVIAQEMEEIDPTYTRDIETYAEDGSVAESTKVLDTANLLAVAMKAIQEQQTQINELKEKLNELLLK